jgi:DNA-binding response OmpR family regulator
VRDNERQANGTVLIVEDDSSIAHIILELLLDEGYAASLLSDMSSDAFRSAVGRLEPDCILLDSYASHGDLDTSWIDSEWAHGRARPVPVVLFTANKAAADEASAHISERSASVFSVVTKPFDIDVLLDTVATAIGSSARFDRSAAGDKRRSDALVERLERHGMRDVRASEWREWVSFDLNGAMTTLYWSQRDGVYYVLREPAESGALHEIGRFHDLDAAMAVAVATTE